MLNSQEERIRGERSKLMQMMNTTFGIDAETMTKHGDTETVEEVIRLFGEGKIGFIRHVLAKSEEAAKGETTA